MEQYYKIHGLIIKSEIEFPEARSVEKQTFDVEVKIGSMPDFIIEKHKKGYNTSILLRKYKWFHFEGEGHFLMENGTTITLCLDNTADDKHIRALILGACLGDIMYQREMVAIHGSAVIWQNKALIISGLSGTGKSTISTEFRKKGCLFLADDTVAITNENGTIYANPAFPQQKLCKDAAIEFGYDLKELVFLNEEREKYAVNLSNVFCSEKKEIAAFVFLNVHEGSDLLIDEVMSGEKLECIIQNLYTYGDFAIAGMNTNVFTKCLEIAQKVPVIRVKRPKNINSAAQIVAQIIEMVENKA